MHCERCPGSSRPDGGRAERPSKTPDSRSRFPGSASPCVDRAALLGSKLVNHREICTSPVRGVPRLAARLPRSDERRATFDLRRSRLDRPGSPRADRGRSVRRQAPELCRKTLEDRCEAPDNCRQVHDKSRPMPRARRQLLSLCRETLLRIPTAALAPRRASLVAPTAVAAVSRASRAVPRASVPLCASVRQLVAARRRRSDSRSRDPVRRHRTASGGADRLSRLARQFARVSRFIARVSRPSSGRARLFMRRRAPSRGPTMGPRESRTSTVLCLAYLTISETV
jgi:hypothetical protein